MPFKVLEAKASNKIKGGEQNDDGLYIIDNVDIRTTDGGSRLCIIDNLGG